MDRLVVENIQFPEAKIVTIQHFKVCRSMEEFIGALKELESLHHTTRFNLDGTWTIEYEVTQTLK